LGTPPLPLQLWLSPSTFAAVKSVQAPPPGSDKPLQWALGAAYDTILSKVRLHPPSAQRSLMSGALSLPIVDLRLHPLRRWPLPRCRSAFT